MSQAPHIEPLATYHREVFVTSSRARTKAKPARPAQVEICYQAHGLNLVIGMAPGDAEAVAEELVHAAARVREINLSRAAAKEPKC
ncbi:hypothetical protein [Acidovorax sp.]|uniref:hypothetical protein n=1 Tax=Acidovorax sp. TaxID=1872122 RepID=UPI0031D16D98